VAWGQLATGTGGWSFPENGGLTERPTGHIIGYFEDESFQTVHYTGTTIQTNNNEENIRVKNTKETANDKKKNECS